MKTPVFDNDYDETLVHTKLAFPAFSGPEIVFLDNPEAHNLTGTDDMTAEEVYRILSTWNACTGVPNEKLTPGILAKLLHLLPDIQNYLEICSETEKHNPDDESHQLLKTLSLL